MPSTSDPALWSADHRITTSDLIVGVERLAILYRESTAVANTTTNVVQQLLAQGMMALRQNAVFAGLVNREVESLTGQKMSSVDVPIPSAITAVAVTSDKVPPTTADVAPTSVTLTLDKWYESPFHLNDKELLEVAEGVVPMQASEAIKALVNQVESDLFACVDGQFYSYVGTAGTTPFASDTSAYRNARAKLNQLLAPMDARRVLLDADAESNLLGLTQFVNANERGDREGILEGLIGRKLGADWYLDQNVPTHTLVGAGTPLIDDASVTVGDTTVHTDGWTTKPVAGDIFTVAGDTQTYTVQSSTTLVGTDSDITFSPAAKVAWADDAAITMKASYVKNLLFQRDAIAFASRPFAGSDPFALGKFETFVDPVSKLALRLEVTREHKRTRFSYDILYGCKVVRPELGCIIAG